MLLTLDEIEKITFGANRIVKDDYFSFHRMSLTEQSVYAQNDDLFRKTYATSGIRLDFETDACSIAFSYKMTRASSRKSTFFDVYINGVFVESIGEINAGENIKGQYYRQLANGKKRIIVYFSNLYNLQLKEVCLGEATFIKPYNYDISILAYGDSITQGYDAIFPSCSYINQLALKLNAYVYNKAIGGDIFRPQLIEKNNIIPDIVTVAYGTNDWSHCTREEFAENLVNFLNKLVLNYSDSKIFVITPIWRKDFEKQTAYGDFSDLIQTIVNECEKYNSITLVKGEELLPHTDLLFSDGYLHPNDLGMRIYADSLYKKMKGNI